MERALTICAAGTSFHARQQGARPRAVFLHGFGGDLQTWDALWSVLGANVSALRYDLRGFGQSIDHGGAAFDHAEDLRAILDACAIDRCDLIGVSMGGAVALNFTLNHPQRVRNLVLISPGLVGWEWSAAWRELWQPIVDSARGGDIDAARQLWWQHPLFATTRCSDAASAFHASVMRYSGAHWLHDYHKLMLPDVERLHELKTRTLLLTGGRDFADFRLIADLIEACAANIRRVDRADRGHLLHLEDPLCCAREILAFLETANARHENDNK